MLGVERARGKVDLLRCRVQSGDEGLALRERLFGNRTRVICGELGQVRLGLIDNEADEGLRTPSLTPRNLALLLKRPDREDVPNPMKQCIRIFRSRTQC